MWLIRNVGTFIRQPITSQGVRQHSHIQSSPAPTFPPPLTSEDVETRLNTSWGQGVFTRYATPPHLPSPPLPPAAGVSRTSGRGKSESDGARRYGTEIVETGWDTLRDLGNVQIVHFITLITNYLNSPQRDDIMCKHIDNYLHCPNILIVIRKPVHRTRLPASKPL